MKARLSMLLGLFLLSGCTPLATPVSYFPVRDAPRPMVARPSSQVKVFDILKPERPYVEMGTLQIHQSYLALESDSDLVVRLRDEAARLGCDGLLMMGDASRGQGRNVRLGLRGACIVYESSPEETRATIAKESKAL